LLQADAASASATMTSGARIRNAAR
jgi:hypothetical protein